jgi:hypothetical protein
MSAWYYKSQSQEMGPFEYSELRFLIKQGQINRQTLIRNGLSGDWARAGKSGKLFPQAARPIDGPTSRPVYGVPTARPQVSEPEVEPTDELSHAPAQESFHSQPTMVAPINTKPSRRRDKLIIGGSIFALLLLMAAILFLIIALARSPAGGGGAGAGSAGGGGSGSSAAQSGGSPATAAATASAATASSASAPPEVPEIAPASASPRGGSAGESDSLFTIGGSDFFGLTGTGTRFVYAVDSSGSMGGPPFSRAKKEVLRSVNGLPGDKEYFVFFFTDDPQPMYWPASTAKSYVGPSSSTFPKLKSWINGLTAGGGNDVEKVVTAALRLSPDTIFLLTDGGFDSDTPAVIRKLNTRRVPINTVAFISRDGETLLKQISKDSGGEYRFVK